MGELQHMIIVVLRCLFVASVALSSMDGVTAI